MFSRMRCVCVSRRGEGGDADEDGDDDDDKQGLPGEGRGDGRRDCRAIFGGEGGDAPPRQNVIRLDWSALESHCQSQVRDNVNFQRSV